MTIGRWDCSASSISSSRVGSDTRSSNGRSSSSSISSRGNRRRRRCQTSRSSSPSPSSLLSLHPSFMTPTITDATKNNNKNWGGIVDEIRIDGEGGWGGNNNGGNYEDNGDDDMSRSLVLSGGWRWCLEETLSVRGGSSSQLEEGEGENDGYYYMLDEEEIDDAVGDGEEEEDEVEYEYYEEEEEEEEGEGTNGLGTEYDDDNKIVRDEEDDFIFFPDTRRLDGTSKQQDNNDDDDEGGSGSVGANNSTKQGRFVPSVKMLLRPRHHSSLAPATATAVMVGDLSTTNHHPSEGDVLEFPSSLPLSSSTSSRSSVNPLHRHHRLARIGTLLLLPNNIIDKHHSILQHLRKNVSTSSSLLSPFNHPSSSTVISATLGMMWVVLTTVVVVKSLLILPILPTKKRKNNGTRMRKKNGRKLQISTTESDVGRDEDNDDEDTMDLDFETTPNKANVIAHHFLPSFITSLSSISLEHVQVWMYRRGNALQHRWRRLFSSSSSDHHRLDSSSIDASDSSEFMVDETDRYTAEIAANERDNNASVGMTARMESSNEAVVKEAIQKATQLQTQLDVLSDSHNSLEREYEASLRMLHDARMQLRRLQQQQQQGNTNGNDADDTNGSQTTREEQKLMMETMAKELEAKYNAQLKDKIERIRTQTENKLRLELEAEIREELTSQQLTPSNMEEERKKLEEQLRSEMEERLLESKVQMENKLTSDFQKAVDEATTIEVNRILTNAIQEAVQAERSKSKEDMLRIRKGIQTILDRERQLMREQVRKVTQQAREYMVNQQREQLLQQAAVLQEEAERFGGGGGSDRGDGGRGGGGGGMMNSGGGNPTSGSGRRRRRDGSGGGVGGIQQRQGLSPLRRRGASRSAAAAPRRVRDEYEDEDEGGYRRFNDDNDGIGGGGD